ncbi:MAG: ligase-associated DNA damage response DEXH box helicase [Xanthobacteraceae bacterium]|nr:ligase-associated DNA damage response DEXH box helicase [Xanthobacteraceae bacterium]
MAAIMPDNPLLPDRFKRWFASHGWQPHAHQLALLEKARAARSSLLIAPTGGGKTLAGFLPSLVELSDPPASRPKFSSTGRTLRRSRGLHTLYLSPLKALAADIRRNLERPIGEMGLPITVEMRTGDTPLSARTRQRQRPPDILLTTPEQLALLLASADAPFLFGDLKRIVLDELHSLVISKRGDLLSLDLARLKALAPNVQFVGLSATVANPEELCDFLVPVGARADLVLAREGAEPDVSVLDFGAEMPWAGHSSRYALAEIYKLIERQKMTLVFVNTRSQAEMVFRELWNINDSNLAIALHHGSLDATRRRKVEAAMGAGKLRAVVCTSSLDLGIDWGDVDLVIHVGAPKGISRLQQRIGRANHRIDEPSRGILVPSNRFEVLECRAAVEALARRTQDTPPLRTGALDVLSQHIFGMACGGGFNADELYKEVTSAAPYRKLSRKDFDDAIDFVATGGYALRVYERFARIRKGADNIWRLTHPRFARQYRMNVGTIVEAAMLRVRLIRGSNKAQEKSSVVARRGRVLGQVEEYFAENLAPGDTFIFGGEILKFEGISENEVLVSRTKSSDPKVPAYDGGKFPLSTFLAEGVRKLIAEPEHWRVLPAAVRDWLELQELHSELPQPDNLLVETFWRGGRNYLVCYPFEGRLAHQTLGMLLTRRLERAKLRPLGFVATEYSLAVRCLGDIDGAIAAGVLSLDDLFSEGILGDDLEAWLAETALMKRSFRNCALISGLVERRFPGMEKTGRQVTISTDLLYDVLRKHEPDHLLMRAARADAATGLLDIRRLGQMLARVKGRIAHRSLDRVSPLAVPVMLEIGRETVYGEGADALLSEAAEDLIREATSDAEPERPAKPAGTRTRLRRRAVPR